MNIKFAMFNIKITIAFLLIIFSPIVSSLKFFSLFSLFRLNYSYFYYFIIFWSLLFSCSLCI